MDSSQQPPVWYPQELDFDNVRSRSGSGTHGDPMGPPPRSGQGGEQYFPSQGGWNPHSASNARVNPQEIHGLLDSLPPTRNEPWHAQAGHAQRPQDPSWRPHSFQGPPGSFSEPGAEVHRDLGYNGGSSQSATDSAYQSQYATCAPPQFANQTQKPHGEPYMFSGGQGQTQFPTSQPPPVPESVNSDPLPNRRLSVPKDKSGRSKIKAPPAPCPVRGCQKISKNASEAA